MKVIFLDFDGVLNTERYVRTCGAYGVAIDPVKMLLLKRIVDASGAEIVLSTSWREHWEKEPISRNAVGAEIHGLFSRYGLQIFDKTPFLNACREDEISAWLDVHPKVNKFVVLDDMFLDSERIRGHFVKTSGYAGGLDEAAANDAIEILNG